MTEKWELAFGLNEYGVQGVESNNLIVVHFNNRETAEKIIDAHNAAITTQAQKIKRLEGQVGELVGAVQWAIGALKTFWQFEPELGDAIPLKMKEWETLLNRIKEESDAK